MKLIKIKNSGDAKTEYVFMQATQDCDVGEYLITDNTYDSSGAQTNKLRHVFFFPPQAVKSGEYVCLWTRSGKYNVADNGGKNQHNFYWKLDEHVWNVNGDTAHLLKAPKSQRKQINT